MTLIILLNNKITELEKLENQITEFCKEKNISEQTKFELNLVLDELFTNIVSYGFRDNNSHTVKIEMSLKIDLLQVTIEDDGIEFNPLENKDPDLTNDLDNKPIGGLGIFFVKQKVDEIYYNRSDNTNVLTFIKKI